MNQVRNKTFRLASKDYKSRTIKALNRVWSQACKVCFKNDTGAAVFTIFAKDKNKNTKNIQEIIPMGPWIFWKKVHWDAID